MDQSATEERVDAVGDSGPSEGLTSRGRAARARWRREAGGAGRAAIRAGARGLCFLLLAGVVAAGCGPKTANQAPGDVPLAPPPPAKVAEAPAPLEHDDSVVSRGWSYKREEPAGAAGADGYVGAAAPRALQQPSRIRGAEAERGLDGSALPRLRPGEELWVIARAPEPADTSAPAGEDYPCLRAKLPGKPREIPLPLAHTDVTARIAGYIAEVRVKQQYQNPYSSKIEAVYVFPLPHDAAVREFVMTIGARRIRGVIREREEAEKVYAEARSQGYVASLLTQERPNIFTQSVANLEPGKAIDIDLTYFNTLAFRDGEYEFVFPMVVGPRFNPPGARDGVGAVAHGQAGTSGQPTEVTYLRPESERSGHDISLAVDLDAGMRIESLASPTHAIETQPAGDERTRVTLSRHDRVPNKDFVLRYRLAGETVKSAFLSHRDERGGYFTLMLQPPASLAARQRAPMEMIFVLDCSGSMNGTPIEIAKGATERALRRLGPDDTFQIIQFSMSASRLGPDPVPATPENVRRGIEFLRGLGGEGGTMMIEGIRAALDFPHDPRRLRVVSFMTDGYIGNEAEILGEIQRRLGAARIFSFGVGSSTNRYLLEGMARVGRGAVAFVGVDEGFADTIDDFYARVSHPALTDIEIDWGALEVAEVYPSRIPDLFVGRPVMLTGRLRNDPGATEIRVRGRAAGAEEEIEVRADTRGDRHEAIASLWARARIGELEDDAAVEGGTRIAGEIREVALAYNLMSAYTAFVAVDSSARTAGDHGTTVVQPVPVPDGVRYDTTVSDAKDAR